MGQGQKEKNTEILLFWTVRFTQHYNRSLSFFQCIQTEFPLNPSQQSSWTTYRANSSEQDFSQSTQVYASQPYSAILFSIYLEDTPIRRWGIDV